LRTSAMLSLLGFPQATAFATAYPAEGFNGDTSAGMESRQGLRRTLFE
jgi:hypothetical protein